MLPTLQSLFSLDGDSRLIRAMAARAMVRRDLDNLRDALTA
jgi:hypothetical protein